MVRINKVTTKSGDQGKTSLYGKKIVSKACQQIEAIGSIDELISSIGMLRSLPDLKQLPDCSDILKKIQNQLFDLGSEIASDPVTKSPYPIKREHVKFIEECCKKFNKDLPALKSFVLPGSSLINSWLHIARTTTRKTEREVVKLAESKKFNPLIIVYLNRLSDLFFILARYSNKVMNKKEFLWEPGK